MNSGNIRTQYRPKYGLAEIKSGRQFHFIDVESGRGGKPAEEAILKGLRFRSCVVVKEIANHADAEGALWELAFSIGDCAMAFS